MKLLSGAMRLIYERFVGKRSSDLPKTLNKTNGQEVYANSGAHVSKSTKQDPPWDLDIPDPKTFLGENYGPVFRWGHKDDLHLNFGCIPGLVMNDSSFFFDYISGKLSAEDKAKYPHHFHQCFGDRAELVKAHMSSPLMEIEEGQFGFIVAYQNVLGLLLVTSSDHDDIQRAAIGFEDNPEQLHYQIQFMRFDPAAIEKMDLAFEPKTLYLRSQVPIYNVNFAKYNDIPSTNKN